MANRNKINLTKKKLRSKKLSNATGQYIPV